MLGLIKKKRLHFSHLSHCFNFQELVIDAVDGANQSNSGSTSHLSSNRSEEEISRGDLCNIMDARKRQSAVFGLHTRLEDTIMSVDSRHTHGHLVSNLHVLALAWFATSE